MIQLVLTPSNIPVLTKYGQIVVHLIDFPRDAISARTASLKPTAANFDAQ